MTIGFAGLFHNISIGREQKWSREIEAHCCKMVALGGENMQEQIEAVQQMQEYIEKHLRENLSFADVAKVS